MRTWRHSYTVIGEISLLFHVGLKIDILYDTFNISSPLCSTVYSYAMTVHFFSVKKNLRLQLQTTSTVFTTIRTRIECNPPPPLLGGGG